MSSSLCVLRSRISATSCVPKAINSTAQRRLCNVSAESVSLSIFVCSYVYFPKFCRNFRVIDRVLYFVCLFYRIFISAEDQTDKSPILFYPYFTSSGARTGGFSKRRRWKRRVPSVYSACCTGLNFEPFSKVKISCKFPYLVSNSSQSSATSSYR